LLFNQNNIDNYQSEFENKSFSYDKRFLAAIQLIQSQLFHNLQFTKSIIDSTELSIIPNVSNIISNWYFLNGFVQNHLEEYEYAVHQYNLALLKCPIYSNDYYNIHIELIATQLNLKNFDYCKKLITEINDQIKIVNEPFIKAKFMCRKGYYFLFTNNILDAHEHFINANEIIENQIDFESGEYIYYYNLIISGLGKINEINLNYESAISNYSMVVNIAETYNIQLRLSWHYLNLANINLAIDDAELAKDYYEKVINLTSNNKSLSYAAALANLGFLELKNYNLSKAQENLNFSKNIYLSKSPIDKFNLSNIELYLSQISIFKKNIKQAKSQLESSLKFAQENGDSVQIAGVCKQISKFFADNNDYKNAYEYQNLYHQLLTNINTDSINRKITNLEQKFKQEKKEKEIEILKLQSISLQLKALRAQMNPHFLYNSLSGIQNSISSNRNVEAIKYLAKFAKLMRQSLEYSDIERITLDQEIEFLESYLEINCKLRFNHQFKYSIIIDPNLETEFIFIPSMIIQPYVENAIEHGLRSKINGELIVKFNICSENTLKCIIDDNGIGREKVKLMQDNLDYKQNHKSMGTQITEQRLILLRQLNRNEIDIKTFDKKDENNQPIGTRVELIIPIFEKKY